MLARLLMAFALLLLVPSQARAAACTATTSGNLTGGSSPTYSGTLGGGCGSLTTADTLAVQTGVTMTQTGDVTLAGITLVGTAAFVSQVGTATSARVLTLGDTGFVGVSTGSQTFKGSYRQRGASTTPTTTLTSANLFYVGDIIPCSASGSINCGTNPNTIRFSYPAKYDTASGQTNTDTYIDTSLNALAVDDVLCFGRDTFSADATQPDEGYCYLVTAKGTTYVEFTTLQQTRESVRTAARQGTVATAVSSTTPVRGGNRNVYVSSSFIASGEERLWVGHWLRFADGAGAAEPYAYMIESVTDGGGGDDIITLADTRGIEPKTNIDTSLTDNIVYPTSRVAWVDVGGWRTGDPYYVMVPAKIASSTACASVATCTDTPVTFSGGGTVRAFVARETGRVKLDAAALTDCGDLFVHENDESSAGAYSAGAILDIRNTTNLTCGHIALIGGDVAGGASSTANKTQHGLYFGLNTNLNLGLVAIRYAGDDALVVPVDATSQTSATIQAARAQWTFIDIDNSTNYFDDALATATWNGTILSGECKACTGHLSGSGSNTALRVADADSNVTLNGIAVLGATQGISPQTNIALCTNCLLFGATQIENQSALPNSLRSSVVRGITQVSGTSWAPAVNTIEDSLIVGNKTQGQALIVTPANTLVSVRRSAFVNNVNTSSSRSVLNLDNPTAASVVEDNAFVGSTAGFTPAGGGFTWGGMYAINDWTNVGQAFRRNLFFGWTHTSATALTVLTADNFLLMSDTSGNCFFGNTSDAMTLTAGQMDTLRFKRGVPPEWRSPAHGGLFSPSASQTGGCTAPPWAGTRTRQAYHGWMQIEPETLAGYMIRR